MNDAEDTLREAAIRISKATDSERKRVALEWFKVNRDLIGLYHELEEIDPDLAKQMLGAAQAFMNSVLESKECTEEAVAAFYKQNAAIEAQLAVMIEERTRSG